MSYIDGVLVAVTAAHKAAFRAVAIKSAAMLKEHGEMRVVQCWRNALAEGKFTDLKRSVKAAGGENVVFSWIDWVSKAACCAGNEKLMHAPRMTSFGDMPFDGQRMIFGASEALFDSLDYNGQHLSSHHVSQHMNLL